MRTISEPLSRRAATIDATVSKEKDLRPQGFPKVLLAVTWLLFFPIQNRLDAPLQWMDERSASDLAQGAQEGNFFFRVLIVLLGAIGLWLVYRYRENFRLSGAAAALFVAFSGWEIVAALWADDPSLTARRLISHVLLLLFCAGCVASVKAKWLIAFVACIPLINLVPGTAVEFIYGNLHPFAGGNRFGGTSPHPNVEAATLAVATVLFFWLTWRSRARARTFAGLGLIVTILFLVMTGSRTALLAAFTSLLFSAVAIMTRDYRRYLPVLFSVIVLIISGFVLLNFLAAASMGRGGIMSGMQVSRDEGDATSFNGRLDLWKTCLTFARERPIVGYGYGGFWSPQRIEYVSAEQKWAIQQSHSAYMDQVLALGIPGAALYTLLLICSIGVALRRFMKGSNTCGAWAALLFFIFIHNMTESINVSPLFTNFAFNVAILSLAFAPKYSLQKRGNVRRNDDLVIDLSRSARKDSLDLSPNVNERVA